MKNRIIAIILIAIMMISLGACSSQSVTNQSDTVASGESSAPAETTTAPVEKTKIVFSFDKGVGDITEKLVSAYNASQDKVTVETIVLPQNANQVHDDFVTKLASGDTSVDLMAIDVIWVSEFGAANWLTDLSNEFDQATQDKYLPGTIEGAKYQGKLVTFPWFTNASVLFYRKDLLENAGLELPKTYADLMSISDKLVGNDGIEYGISFQGALSEAMVCNWVEYVWANGGTILDENGKAVINSAENIEATKIMVDLAKDYAPKGVTTYTEPESEQVFLEGKAVFHRNWPYVWDKTSAEGSKVKDKVGFMALPVGPEGTVGSSCMGGLNFAVNGAIDDKQKAAAIDFIKYMSGEEGQKVLALNAFPPALMATYKDADVLAKVPMFTDFFEIIKNGKPRPLSPQYPKVSAAIQKYVHQALSGTMTVEEALNAVQKEVELIG